MSVQTLSPAAGSTAGTAGGPADAIAATQRVQQLQTLIAQAKQGGSTASFAAALDAASGQAGNGQSATAPESSAPASAGLASATYPASGASIAASSAGVAEAATGYIPATAAPSPSLTASAGLSGASTGAASVAASSATPPSGSPAATQYDEAIAQAAARYNLDPAVLHGLIQQESGFNPNSRSSAGALGLTQLMPGTASSLGVSNPLDPVQSIEGGARYLSQMMSQFGGNTEGCPRGL